MDKEKKKIENKGKKHKIEEKMKRHKFMKMFKTLTKASLLLLFFFSRRE